MTKPTVGQTVLVGSSYESNPEAVLRPFVVVAVKRKYFTVDWVFQGSSESFPAEFEIETGEMKENRWISGYPKAWATREDFIQELAAKKQEQERDELRRKVNGYFPDYGKLKHDQLAAIWAIIQPTA